MQVGLHRHIPVYISYFTLRVNEDGSITTFRDLYGHDARMAAALFDGQTNFAAPSDDEILTQSIQQQGAQRRGRRDPTAGFFRGFN